ncbi:MAG: mandelate racemase [Alphaproteobacteria bacterium]|nr:mandelate racemase [Alphaproteobacteria bacterium]
MPENSPFIRKLGVRGVIAPMKRPLATGSGSVSQAPLALVDLECDNGVRGCAYVFCFHAFALAPTVRLIQELGALIEGETLAPIALSDMLRARMRLLGQQGLAMMASAGIDMAAWDALAKTRDVPLARLLGGDLMPLPAYNSNGLGIIGAGRAVDEARELVEEGFSAIKLRLGYPDARTDLEVAEAVRAAVGGDIRIMTDYNQCLTVPEAEKRASMLAGLDLEWIEEPVRFDDYAGYAQIRKSARTPIQLGENCWGVHDMQKVLDAGAADVFMPDACKIGGVTGWLRAAGLADGCGLTLSSHLYPEISAHLLPVTPTRHWLEYVDWGQPVLKRKLQAAEGHVIAPDVPGIGIEWDEDAVARYLVE